MNDEKLLSIPETAEALGVSETIVRRLMDRGDIQPAKIEQRGNQIRRWFRASDVETVRRRRAGEAVQG